MKCIHCQHDCSYRERSDGRCPQCRHSFAFEPRNGDPMTDAAFAAAIERVSAGGSVRFNADHLYYEVRRRYLRRPVALAGFIGLALAISVVCFIIGSLWAYVFWVAALCCIFGSYGWILKRGVVPWRELRRAAFDLLWHRYVQAHGAPQGLIERRSREAPADFDPTEMLAYSFDRVVICDRPETVDLLIANQFHFENNCAVLSIDGYPPHAFETVRRMLGNNPRLAAFALHDASVAGCQLAHRLKNDAAWFKNGVPVHDVGLRPRHRSAFPGQHEHLSVQREVRAGMGISSNEARWLGRNVLALAVVIPEQIIKRLYRAITLAEDRQDHGGDNGGSGGGSGAGDSGSERRNAEGDLEFQLDADLSDGGGDSFG